MYVWSEWPEFFRGARRVLSEMRWPSELVTRHRLVLKACCPVSANEPRKTNRHPTIQAAKSAGGQAHNTQWSNKLQLQEAKFRTFSHVGQSRYIWRTSRRRALSPSANSHLRGFVQAASAVIFVRLSDLLPRFQEALYAARAGGQWDTEILRRVIAHEFDFLGPFVSARVERGGIDGHDADDLLVLEFTPPEPRDLAAAERAFSKATARAERGDVGGAISELQRLAQSFPEISKYRRALGQAYLALEDWDRGEDELLKSLALDPRDPDALTLLGNLYARKGQPEKAIPLYRRSLELQRNVYALTNVGAAIAETGNKEEAIQLFREAVALNGQFPNAWYGLGLMLSQLQDLGRLREAIDALDHALAAAGERRKAPQVWDSARGLLQRLSDIEAREEAKQAGSMLRAVAASVEADGGLPVRVETASLRGILAKIELGWVHGRDHHRLLVNRQAGFERVHQERHELEHVRLANAARHAGVNKWFASTPQSRELAVRSIRGDIERLSRSGHAEDDIPTLVLSWVDGLLLQLYNFPIDLLIESRLLTDHPEFRELWYYSLRLQLEAAARIAEDKRLSELTARTIYRANTAMNGASALWFESQFPRRTDLLARFQKTESFPMAKKLYSIWSHDVQTWSPGKEFAWIDEWAQIMGLQGWYIWKDGNA
jgi:tetratricopeptide (TPR) repeat protein